jgi:hypothetical protein
MFVQVDFYLPEIFGFLSEWQPGWAWSASCYNGRYPGRFEGTCIQRLVPLWSMFPHKGLLHAYPMALY